MPKTTSPPNSQPITLTSAAVMNFQSEPSDGHNFHSHWYAMNPTHPLRVHGFGRSVTPVERRSALVTLLNSVVAAMEEDMED
jgi:hypothetical protein